MSKAEGPFTAPWIETGQTPQYNEASHSPAISGIGYQSGIAP